MSLVECLVCLYYEFVSTIYFLYFHIMLPTIYLIHSYVYMYITRDRYIYSQYTAHWHPGWLIHASIQVIRGGFRRQKSRENQSINMWQQQWRTHRLIPDIHSWIDRRHENLFLNTREKRKSTLGGSFMVWRYSCVNPLRNGRLSAKRQAHSWQNWETICWRD